MTPANLAWLRLSAGNPRQRLGIAAGDPIAHAVPRRLRAHRNHLSLGLDMRSPAGAALFERLVAASDAVFANFKPGTLAALGFSYERLLSTVREGRSL